MLHAIFARVCSDRAHAPLFTLDVFCQAVLALTFPLRRLALRAAEPPQEALTGALIAGSENDGVPRCSVLELSYQPPET